MNCSPPGSSSDDQSSKGLPPPTGGPNSTGRLLFVNDVGFISGWAQDPDSPSLTLLIRFYLDGPPGVGTLVNTVVANKPGIGTHTGHYFEYKIPPAFIDNTPHDLYAVIVIPDREISISGSPQNYVAFTPREAGRVFYMNNLFGSLGSQCSGCHAVNYDAHYNSLLIPNLFDGGTATNNRLINKASGQGHGGGSHCTNKNSGLCSDLQQWWRIEFQ